MSNNTKAKMLETIQITGDITVTSPLLIGDGEKNNEAVDALVLRNRYDKPYIPATSLAGVLRHHVVNYLEEDISQVMRNIIFGSLDQGASVKTGDHQSILRVYDVVLTGADGTSDVSIVTRDGVRLEHYRRVAKDGHKFDYEAIDKGAIGTVAMECIIRQGHLDILKNFDDSLTDTQALTMIREAVFTIANMLYTGISVGRYTTKGFGQIKSHNVEAHVYQLQTMDSIYRWVMRDQQKSSGDMVHKGQSVTPKMPHLFHMKVWANIDSALIVRTISQNSDVDSTMLMSGDDYVIPGSSIKGVIRHHSQSILEKMGVWESWNSTEQPDTTNASRFVSLFGGMMATNASKLYKSRVSVSEAYIAPSKAVRKMKQTRNRIDRFTGGTIDSALFDSEPIWQVENPKEGILSFEVNVQNCVEDEAGLMFVLLRDLWMGKLTFGGEASIGRGRLRGVRAEVIYNGETYTFENEYDADGRIAKYATESNGNIDTINECIQYLQMGI